MKRNGKRSGLIAAAAFVLAAAGAGAAMADDISGTVTVNGSVAAKCNVSGSFSATLALGELAQANGRVVTSFAGPNVASFSIQCTDANPTVTVSATPMVYAAGGVGNGYTNTVHYTATVAAQKATSGSASFAYTTADALPAATTGAVGAALKNAANNVSVTVSNPTTTNATDILDATSGNDYVGTVTVTISPT